MNNIPALILARGGSKGIPGKNLKRIEGMTLIARIAFEAVKSRFDPVYVYSDNVDILNEARLVGAMGVERPEEVSGDQIASEATVKAFLKQEDPRGNQFRALALLQCTTPFLKQRHLDAAWKKFTKSDFDSVVTATRMIKFLGYEKFNKHSEFIPLHPYRDLRQSMSWGEWVENGGLYLATRFLWDHNRRIGQKCGVVEMSWWESLEIDDPIDLEVARRLADLFLEGVKNGAEKQEHHEEARPEDEKTGAPQG